MIIFYSIEWYIFILLLGTLSFLLTFKVFHKLTDQGYCISKTLGILFSAFISWILMTYKISDYTFTSTISYISAFILLFGAILCLIFLLSKEELKELFTFIDKRYLFIIFIEATLLIFIIFGAYIRAFSPDILTVHKLQDFIYIKSIMQSSSLPPDNLWLSGYKLNYYYLGYFIVANLMNTVPISMDLSFNLLPGTILGLIVITSGGIIYNLTNNKFYSILGGLLTGFISNYQGFYQILQFGLANGFDWQNSVYTLGNGSFTEFPFWSFTLGDIQSFYICHVLILALIYVVCASTLENNFILWPKLSPNKIIYSIITIIITAMIIPTNIFASLCCILILIILPLYALKSSNNKPKTLLFIILTLITYGIIVGLINLPFFMSYNSPLSDLKLIDSNNHTNFNSFFIIFGAFIVPVIFFILCQLKNILKLSTSNTVLSIIAILSLIEIFLLYIFKVNSTFINVTVILSLLIICYFCFSKIYKTNNNDTFIINIAFLGLLLAILVILYLIIKSPVIILMIGLIIFSCYVIIKEHDFDRYITFGLLSITSIIIIICDIAYLVIVTNDNGITISFLYMQAQLLFPIILTMVIYYTLKSFNNLSKEIYITAISLLLLPCFIFTILGPYYKSQMFKPIEGLIPNLSGTNHLIVFHECDNLAIEWIKDTLTPGTVILEAYKPGNILNGRISGYTGMSTVIAGKDEINFIYGNKIRPIIQERLYDINTIYSEPDKRRILSLIKKYNIQYVYVGEIENSLYKPSSLEGFGTIGTIVNNAPTCKLYKMF